MRPAALFLAIVAGFATLHGCAEFDPYQLRPILFASARTAWYDIWELGEDGSLKNLTDFPASDTFPIWSPKGDRVAFWSDRSGFVEVHVMNADGSDQRQLTFDTQPKGDLSWSGDGDLVYYSRYNPLPGGTDTDDVFAMPVQGGTEIPVIVTPLVSDRDPTVSREGKIAWVRDFDLFVANLDGSDLVQLTSSGWLESNPAFSPDGQFIAYSSFELGPPNIAVIRVDGSLQWSVTNDALGGEYAAWAQDGTRLVFTRGPLSDLWTARMDGSDFQPALEDSFASFDPTW